MFLGSLIYGFINSSILALLAMGFNLTFGISGVANFAYGAIYILSGFFSWICINSLGLPYFLSVFISILCAVVVGILMLLPDYPESQRAFSFRGDGYFRARLGDHGVVSVF